MKHRGKILRDTNTGPGLLSSNGTQHPFTLETHWKSDTPPKVGMVVDVTLDGAGSLAAAMPVAESQLAKEQAELAVQAARAKGGELAASLTARFGLPTLVAMAVLLVGWFFLNTIAVQVSSQYSVGMSFWKLLGVLNSPNGLINGLNGANAGSGIYGFMCVVALLAPLAPQVWNDKRAHLGGLLPLAFMLIVALMAYLGVNDSLKQAQGAASFFGGEQAARMAESVSSMMLREAMRAISIGAGAYLSLLASLYLASRSTMKFLAAKA
ncbi:hypothetical protein [Massilia alkalitolerans]|jgi:hypothetical protein|uniref:hypothetical protein n=1 Tax=Massilia alkalitolerans TaxID=286638 RepID=UPI0003FEA59D|nr:hypothetical protein [Massilia alkalitolerans]